MLDHIVTGRLDDVAPEPADEDVLDQLTRTTGNAYVCLEAWLTAAYLDGTGCYADPAVRAASQLPELLLGHANRRHSCPPGCPGTGAQCDGCAQACGGDAHRRQALMSRLFAHILADRQQEARRLLVVPVAGPDAPA